MLKERCRDPNVLYNAKEWTLHNYQDSVKMGAPMMMCVHKVVHPEPIFFEKLEEMKTHWQSCLSLSLVAQPAIALLDKGKGACKGRCRFRGPLARGGHIKAEHKS